MVTTCFLGSSMPCSVTYRWITGQTKERTWGSMSIYSLTGTKAIPLVV
jgi:hypothetical protein